MIHTDWGWMAFVGSTVLLPDSRGRRLAAAGLGALVLALAALQAGNTSGGLPGDFAAVELALVLVGLTALLGGVVRGTRAGLRGMAAASLALVGVALAWGPIGTIARAAPLGESAAAIGVVGGAAGLAWAAARWLLARRGIPAQRPVDLVDLRSAGTAVVGALLAGFGPHLFVVGLGVLIASLAVWVGATRPRTVPDALPALLAIATLIPAGWLLLAIAGEQGLALATLPDLPLSPAAETLLAPLFLLAGWSPAGLWPSPRTRVTGIAGVAGLFLVARVVGPVLSEGLEHWRPLAFPILAIGLWQGAVAGRWPAVMIGGAMMALASGSVEGPLAAVCLGGAALVTELVARATGRELAWLRCAALLAAGYGVWPATVAGLRAEVVYTTLTVAGLAVLLAAGGRVDPSTGQVHISRFDT